MYTRLSLERLCNDQLEGGNDSLNFILTYDIISRIMINLGAWAEYSHVEMMLGALPRDLRAKAGMKIKPDPIEPSTFKYNELWKHVLDNCATAYTLALPDSEGAQTAPGISPHSIPAGVALPQMPAMIILPAILSEETLAPGQAMEDKAITIAENSIDTSMDNMRNAFEAWTVQLSNANKPRYTGYQTARSYPIQADQAPPHTPMNFPPRNAPTGPAYYRQCPNYQ